jgi:hypothetical protein
MCRERKFQQRLLDIFQKAMASAQIVISIALPNWDGLDNFRNVVKSVHQQLQAWSEGDAVAGIVQGLDALIEIVLGIESKISTGFQTIMRVVLEGLISIIVMLEENSPNETPAAAEEDAYQRTWKLVKRPDYPVFASANDYKQTWNGLLDSLVRSNQVPEKCLEAKLR